MYKAVTKQVAKQITFARIWHQT